jgi:(p)ppGpp synthase/HD superfamily hydrolase
MTYKGELLGRMLRLAVEYHDGSYDKSGRPYILHPLAVMHKLRTDDEELQCIALGHDLIEDTAVTRRMLERLHFPERVIAGIECLSKKDGQSYEDYKAQVKSNKDAVLVKMKDLLHNADLRRMKGVTKKDIERTNRYYAFYFELQTHLGMMEIEALTQTAITFDRVMIQRKTDTGWQNACTCSDNEYDVKAALKSISDIYQSPTRAVKDTVVLAEI